MSPFGAEQPYPPGEAAPPKKFIFFKISLKDICGNYKRIYTKFSEICLLTTVISLGKKFEICYPL